MPRTRSGPPVAASSSAAANNARIAQRDGVVERHVFGPARLDPVAGVDAARTLTLVVVFLVAAAGDVVGEHASHLAVLVVAGEQRHDREALHRGGQVAAHEQAELVGLALEAQHLALHLLVVLELGLEQLHHLDRGPGRARDRDAGEVVGREHLVDAAVGDRCSPPWPAGRPPSPRRRRSGSRPRSCRAARRPAAGRAHAPARELVRAHLAQELGERRSRIGTRGEQRQRARFRHRRGAYSRISARQRNHPIPARPVELVVALEVVGERTERRSASSPSCPIAMLQFQQRMPRTRPVA